MGYVRKKARNNENSLPKLKKTLVCHLHKRNSEARMKKYKVKISRDECEKLNFPHICNTTSKEEILELITIFFRHIRDCRMLILKLFDETEGHKAEHLKAKKKVCRLLKGCLFGNITDKWEAAAEAHAGRKYNLEKLNSIARLFLSKALPCDTVD